MKVKATVSVRSATARDWPLERLLGYCRRQVVRDGWARPGEFTLSEEPTKLNTTVCQYRGTLEVSQDHADRVAYFGDLQHKTSQVWLVLQLLG